ETWIVLPPVAATTGVQPLVGVSPGGIRNGVAVVALPWRGDGHRGREVAREARRTRSRQSGFELPGLPPRPRVPVASGRSRHPHFAGCKDVNIPYLCDVDDSFFPFGQKLLAKHERPEARIEKDLRRVLQDKNVDAVVVALPDHWHALATIWACQAGKHVYCEK